MLSLKETRRDGASVTLYPVHAAPHAPAQE